MGDFAYSTGRFASGIVRRSYYWLFVLLLDPFGLYGKYRPVSWPKIEVSGTAALVVLLCLVLWTALLTYHDLRMKVAPYNHKDRKLRDALVQFLRNECQSLSASTGAFAQTLALMGPPDLLHNEDAKMQARATVIACTPHTKALFDLINSDAFAHYDLKEVERVLMEFYNAFVVAIAATHTKCLEIKIQDSSASSYKKDTIAIPKAFNEMMSKLDQARRRFEELIKGRKLKIMNTNDMFRAAPCFFPGNYPKVFRSGARQSRREMATQAMR